MRWPPGHRTAPDRRRAKPRREDLAVRPERVDPERAISIAAAERGISDLDWSPVSGLIVAVTNDLRGRYTIWTIRPDGSEQREIVVEDGEIPSARWAPRGNAMYYFKREEQAVSLVKVPFSSDPGEATGGGHRASLTGLETDGAFSISSDGKQLVYARAPFYSNLWMVDASAARSGRVTATAQLTQGTSLIERTDRFPGRTAGPLQRWSSASRQPLHGSRSRAAQPKPLTA